MKTDTDNITASSVCDCTTEDFIMSGTVIETDVFKSSASEYTRLAFKDVIARKWWIIVFPTIIFSTAALIFDTRWLFITLIFIFIIAPFLLVNTYFSRLLTPHIRLAISEKQIKIISGKQIELSFIDSEGIIKSTQNIQWTMVKQIKSLGNSWLIELMDSPVGGIIIPNSAIIHKYQQQNNDN